VLCILLLAVSETVELFLHVIVASKDDKDDTLFSVVLAFINVDVDEVADGGTSSVLLVVGIMLVVAFLADTVTDVEGLLFLSITGDCSRSEVVEQRRRSGLDRPTATAVPPKPTPPVPTPAPLPPGGV
jgi:hypothetical protein